MYQIRYKSHHDASRRLKDCFTIEVDKEKYLKEVLSKPSLRKRVIYIHVPFCNKICSFCPFNFPNKIRRDTYDQRLIEEMDKIKDFPYFDTEIDAINFGGGTPTALKPKQMENILSALHDKFKIKKDAEISVETSISELSTEMLTVLKKEGVNRFSIGVQTFNNKARKMMNRRGTGEAAITKIKEVLAMGFKNTSLDLIYNYPNQTEADLLNDLKIIKELKVAGISFYSLSLFPKTKLAQTISEKDKESMENLTHEQNLFNLIVNELAKAHYTPLELTKLVRDNIDKYDYMNIKHNNGCCIALGHGAGGNIENYIYRNSYDYHNLATLPIPAMGRIVSDEYFKLDKMIYQMEKGHVNLKEYSTLLNLDLETMLKGFIDKLEKEKLITYQNSILSLTLSGMFFGNNIIADLIDVIIDSLTKNHQVDYSLKTN